MPRQGRLLKCIAILMSLLLVPTSLWCVEPQKPDEPKEGPWSSPKAKKKPPEAVVSVVDSTSTGDCALSMLQGKQDASALHSRSGWAVGGFFSGLALGLIGTGIITAVASGGEPEPKQVPPEVHELCYRDGYSGKAKSMNTRAALGGGLIGTVVIVGILLVAYQGD